jgi:hypothetical protein
MNTALRSGLRWALIIGLCGGICAPVRAERKADKAKTAAEKAKDKQEADKKKDAAAKRQKAADARKAASAKAINPSSGTAITAEKKLQDARDAKQKQIDAQYAKSAEAADPTKLALALQRGGLSTEALKRLETRLRLLSALQRSVLKDERVMPAELTAMRSEIALVASVVAEGLAKDDGAAAPALLQRDSLRNRLQEGPLEASEASEIFRDMARILHIKNRLATEIIAADGRKGLLRELNSLINTYFEAG